MLTRTFYILLDLIHTQEEYAKLKQDVRAPSAPPAPPLTPSAPLQTAKSSRDSIAAGDQTTQIAELKQKLAAAEQKSRDYGACASALRP